MGDNRAFVSQVLETRAMSAVRDAMKFRIAIIQASAGWGKTTAVRAVLRDTTHVWVDLGSFSSETGAIAFALARAFSIDSAPLGTVLRTVRKEQSPQPFIDWFISHPIDFSIPIVIDDLHVLINDRLSLDILSALITFSSDSRWVLLSRQSVFLPYATWLAYGHASLPVSEDDLSLDISELRMLLSSYNYRSDDAAVQTLFDATGGWPVAVHFFLHAFQRSSDLTQVATMAKDIAFAYLAEQLFMTLPSQRQELVSLLAFSGSCDALLLSSLGYKEPLAELAWLRDGPLPIHESSQGLRLHDLFCEFIRRTLSSESRSSSVQRILCALQVSGRIVDAVDIARVFSPSHVGDLLATQGFTLLEAGRWETAEHALQCVPIERRRTDPAILGLRASIEAAAGSFDRAEGIYLKALMACTDVDLRSSLARRLSLLYINRAQKESLETIGSVLEEGSDRNRCEALSVYAMALSITGNRQSSLQQIGLAVAAAESIADDHLIARIRMRSAWVAFHSGDDRLAERESLEAVRLSESLGDWLTYTLSQSTLCSCMLVYRDDLPWALHHAQLMSLGATRAGDRQLRSFALWAQHSMEVERAHHDRLALLDLELHGDPFGFRDGFFARYSSAVRLGWQGRFSDAVHRLSSLDGTLHDPSEERAWRSALAMFYAFAGRESEAKRYLQSSASSQLQVPASSRHYESLAVLYAAFAEIFVGRSSLALRRLNVSFYRLRDTAMAHAARSLAQLSSFSSTNHILDALRAAQCEGFADLLSAAFALHPDDVRTLSLTDAELTVLRALNDGSSPKRIAQATDRSIETVRNHIKSAIRKLGVSGSREAVSLARRLGAFDS